MPVVRSRFLIEAGFIIAVAVIAGVERVGTGWIILVVVAAWIVVAVVEIAVWARRSSGRQAEAHAPPEQPLAPPPIAAAATPRPEARTERPVEPESVREPPLLQAVPAPAAVPERKPELIVEPEPVPAPESARVLAFTPANHTPREWNLWELERAARDHGDDDIALTEERSYLLMYLREFAGPDGVLPADFDGLVRDAFGDVLHSVGV